MFVFVVMYFPGVDFTISNQVKMAATIVCLVLAVLSHSALAAPDPNINTYVGQDGRSYYKSPLYCSYSSLLTASYYNSLRATYTNRGDRNCCYLADSRNNCCEMSQNGVYAGCKCDPKVICDITTTTTESTTTATTPTTTPTTPTTTPTTPTTITTTPTTTPTTPTTTPTTPTTTPTTPITTATKPTTTTTTPTTTTTKPTTTTTKPTTTSTTTTTTTPTTTPTTPTTTTTKPTTTTTKPTTTTTKPTTTTTKPTTTTAKTTPTTATKPTTTTPVPTTTSKLLCNRPTGRILNGARPPSNCLSASVLNITFSPDGTQEIVSCNAVYTTATVNGQYKATILTSDSCRDMISQSQSAANAFSLYLGSQKYGIIAPRFSLIQGPKGAAFLDIQASESSLLNNIGACQDSVCPYQSSMDGLVDTSKCTVYSWGISNAEDFSADGLNEVAVELNEGGCSDIEDESTSSDTGCFKTVSGNTLNCASDAGAPVYCSSLNTNEKILMGVLIYNQNCDDTDEVKVIQVSS